MSSKINTAYQICNYNVILIHHYLAFPALNVQMIHSHFLPKAIISIYSKPIKTFACGASKKQTRVYAAMTKNKP